MPPPERFTARLARARTLSPSVRELGLERVDGAALHFAPGQWVNVLLPTADGELKRAYSIASPPGGGRFDLAVTRVEGGPMSERLHALPVGAELTVIGPQGLFTRPADDPAPALFVGTGTGVTPLRSMILAALAAGSRARLWLLFGVRREEDVLYRDELAALAEQHPNLRVEVTLSKAHEGWAGRRGWVQEHLPALWSELADPAAHLYVCGLDRMVGAVRALARGELGIERRHVHQERYD